MSARRYRLNRRSSKGRVELTDPVRAEDPQQRLGRAMHGTENSQPVLSQTWTAYEASCRRPTRNRTGTAISWATTENAISAGSDTSYSRPISALPANQSRPYPLLKIP